MASIRWHRCALAVLLLVCVRLQAQDPYSETAHPTPERIATLLKSGDPLDRAWGAFHAVHTNDASFLPELTGLAERWEPLPHALPGQPPPSLDARQRGELDTMAGVLDGVIQFKGTLSPKVLLALAGDLPAQVAILLSRLSPSEAEPVLMAIFNDPKPANWVETRFSAQMLMLRPPPTFAAKLLHDTRIRATIFVIDLPGGIGMGSSNDFGSGGGVPGKAGWPTVGQYKLLENTPNEPVTLIPIVRGRRPLFAMRVLASHAFAAPSGHELRMLNDPVRLEILAVMAGVTDKALDITASPQTNILATTTEEYETGLTLFVTKRLDAFQAVERRLTAKGYVSLDEMASGASEPELMLILSDFRQNKSFDLPKIAFSRGRVSWSGP